MVLLGIPSTPQLVRTAGQFKASKCQGYHRYHEDMIVGGHMKLYRIL